MEIIKKYWEEILMMIGIGIVVVYLLISNYTLPKNFNLNNCENQTTVPFDKFCSELGMEKYIQNSLFYSTMGGCLTKDNEIRFYTYSFNRTENTWTIGNKKYNAEWSCK